MSEWLGVELDWGGFVTGNRVSKISQQQEDQEDSLPGEVGEGERELCYDSYFVSPALLSKG